MNYSAIIKKAVLDLKKTSIQLPELDARVILEHILKRDSSYIYSHPEMLLTNAQFSRFQRLIRQRQKGMPIAYITGHKEFYGLDFFVNKNVLIPRPETELLVEQAIEFIKCHCAVSAKKQSGLPRSDRPASPAGGSVGARNDRNGSFNIIDVGTGSGCIIISILKEIQKLEIGNCLPAVARLRQAGKLEIKYHASDISRKALYIAKKNAELHKVNSDIRFFHSDIFANKRMPKKYDIIIANLPYVPKNNSKLITNNFPTIQKCRDSDRSVRIKLKDGIYFEPQDAIFAKDNGMRIIKKFLDQAKNHLNSDGLILFEVDPRNAKELKRCAQSIFPQAKIEIIKDLANHNRAIKIILI